MHPSQTADVFLDGVCSCTFPFLLFCSHCFFPFFVFVVFVFLFGHMCTHVLIHRHLEPTHWHLGFLSFSVVLSVCVRFFLFVSERTEKKSIPHLSSVLTHTRWSIPDFSYLISSTYPRLHVF